MYQVEKTSLWSPNDDVDVTMIDKQKIARSFSQASASYDAVAHFQQQVGQNLFARMKADVKGVTPRVLDLGSGTGFFTQELSQLPGVKLCLAADLAHGMNRFAQQKYGVDQGIHWLTADAENLPLAANSVDLIFANLSLQWCQQLDGLAASLNRVLAPGGQVWFSSLDPGTLGELAQAWARVDQYQHVNEFISPETLVGHFETQGFSCSGLSKEKIVLHYQQPLTLMQELKKLGAHNVNDDARHQLTGAGRLKKVLMAYPRDEQGLCPATYQVSYLGFKKT